jgi:hypothetical protein
VTGPCFAPGLHARSLKEPGQVKWFGGHRGSMTAIKSAKSTE